MTSFLRTTMFYAVAIAAAVLFAWQPVWAEEDDLDTQLTLCTFKLSNPGSTATVFFLTRPDPKHADRTQFILVTAEHVFSRMKGEEATLALRKRQPDGQYVKSPLVLKVRSGGKPLWTRHPAADVAVMAVSPPPGVSFPHLGLDILARDEDLRKCEIHPGDTLHCVGYPHPNEFEANAAGFPVTRSGCIASFPLLPTDKTKGFLLDFNTFEGDSGAPVYLAEDHRGSSAGRQQPVRLILGLVRAQEYIDDNFHTSYETIKISHRMGLGHVVHAAAIRETIDRLPGAP